MNNCRKMVYAALCVALSVFTSTAQIKVDVSQPILPVLAQKNYNPVLRLDLIKSCAQNCKIEKIALEIDGDIHDIESVSLMSADQSGKPEPTAIWATESKINKEVVLSSPVFLLKDTTTVWVSAKLKERIDMTHKYKIVCKGLEAEHQQVKLNELSNLQYLRTGIAVRKHNQNNIHTSRIPGLATSNNQTLLAIYDARYETSRDLQGNIDIVLNRSLDGGTSWEPTQVIMDMGTWGNLPEKYNGVSDACILVDSRSNTIYVAGLWMHGVLDGKTGMWVDGLTNDSTRWIHQWVAKGSQPGLGVKETSQFLITKSMDNGLTWSEPVNITAQTKRPEWWLYAPAPGHGITLADGTLVFPTQGRDKTGKPFSNITYSRDGGRTWIASNPAYDNTTECMAVQLADGGIMLNMRDNRNYGNQENNGRRICVTYDLGKTWVEHPTSRKALIEPTCMASLHKHQYMQDGVKKSLLLFCNPESISERNHMTLKVSFDDGRTWPDEYKILLDEWDSFGYSCITSVDDETIGVLYESSQAQMVFQKIKVEELLTKRTSHTDK